MREKRGFCGQKADLKAKKERRKTQDSQPNANFSLDGQTNQSCGHR
jgi:hypothetical protein